MVVNVGAHWVTICIDREFVLYLDSYGMPPALPAVRRFLRRCAEYLGLDPDKRVFYNGRTVQAWDSNYCGVFAVLWTLCLAMTATEASEEDRRAVDAAKIEFMRAANKLKHNDNRCAKFLRRLSE